MSLRKKQESEKIVISNIKKEIDRCLTETVEFFKRMNKDLKWRQISSMLFERHNIKLDYKKCYNRYKERLDPQFIQHPDLQRQKKNKIFQFHCFGTSNQEIKKRLEINWLGSTAIKNSYRVPKQSMCRVLRDIYSESFASIQFPSTTILKKNEEFKVFLVLFSAYRLLAHYLKCGLNIFAFRAKTAQYENWKKQFRKQKNKHSSKYEFIAFLQQNIRNQLEMILTVYLNVLDSENLKKKLIGSKMTDKESLQKINFLKVIILSSPIKLFQRANLTKLSLSESVSSNRLFLNQQQESQSAQLSQGALFLGKDILESGYIFNNHQSLNILFCQKSIEANNEAEKLRTQNNEIQKQSLWEENSSFRIIVQGSSNSMNLEYLY